MAQDMQDAGNVSAELDAMVCDLIGAFLDDLAAGENPGVVVAIEDAASNRYLAALDEDGEEACLEAATNFISEHKMGLKDEGLGRIARYAIGYTGCVEIDGGYHFTKKQIIKDEERTEILNSNALEIIRFKNEERNF